MENQEEFSTPYNKDTESFIDTNTYLPSYNPDKVRYTGQDVKEDTSNDAFYAATALIHNESPVDNYFQMTEELKARGDSETLKVLRNQYIKKKDLERALFVENLVNDQELTKEEKRYVLQKQLLFNNPKNAQIRSAYLETVSMVDEFENPSINDNIINGTDLKIHGYKTEEDFYKALDTVQQIRLGIAPENQEELPPLNGSTMKTVLESVYDPVMAEPLALFKTVVWGLFPYIAELSGTGIVYASQDDVKTVTEARNVARKWLAEHGSEDWMNAFDTIVGYLGIEPEDLNEAWVTQGFSKLDEGLTWAATKLSPNDVDKAKIPLEILTALAIPIFKKGKKLSQDVYLRVTDPNAYQVKKLLESDIKTSTPVEMFPDETHTKKAESLNIDVPKNSPFDATINSSKIATKDYANAIMKDNTGKVLETFKYTLDSFISKFMMIPIVNSVFKGEIYDNTARFKELYMVQKDVAREYVLNPYLVDIGPRKMWLEENIHIINDAPTSIKIEMSPVQSKFDYATNGTQMEVSLRFNKDGFNFDNIAETVESAVALKKKTAELNKASDQPAGDVFIEWLDNEGNILGSKLINESTTLDTFLSESLAKGQEPILQHNNYRINWNRKADFFDQVKELGEGFGKQPWMKDESLGWLGRVVTKGREFIFDNTNASGWLAAFGKSDKKIEQAWSLAHMTAERSMKRQLEVLGRDITSKTKLYNLNAKQYRTDLKKLYEESRNRSDIFDIKEIYDILDYNAPIEHVRALQNTLALTRQIDRFSYKLLNQHEISRYAREGFKDYVDINVLETGGRQRIMVKDEFIFEELTADGKVNMPVLWDMEAGKSVQFIANEINNSRVPIEQFLWEGNKPGRKIVQLAKPFIDSNGNLFDYALLPKNGKLTGTPDWIVPSKTGHLSRISLGNYFVKAYPKVVVRNGKTSRPLPERVIKDHENYGQTVAMFRTKVEAQKWLDQNMNKVPELNGEKVVAEIKIADELAAADNLEFNIVQQAIARPAKAANEHIYNAIYEDPLTSFILTSQRLGTDAYLQPVIAQMKQRWLNTYKDVINLGKLDNSGFPVRPESISAIPGKEKIFRQAAAEWKRMHELEIGYSGQWGARYLSMISDKIGSAFDVDNKLAQFLSRQARKLERNPNVVLDFPRRVATTFYITFANIFRNLTLQPIGIFGPMIVGPNSTKVMLNTVAGVHAAINRHYNRNPKYSKYNDSIWEYVYEQGEVTKSLGKEAGQLLSHKDQMLILKHMEDSGYGIIGEHYLARGIMSNAPASLSNKGLHNTFGRGLKGFVDWYNKIGFEAGEYMNRLGMWHASRELWISNNPGKNWRSRTALDEITYGAHQLAGSMTKENAYAFQKIPLLSTISQFGAFSMKASESIWNKGASPYSAKQRAALAGYNMAVFGVRGGTIYGIGNLLMDWLDSNGMDEMATKIDNLALTRLVVNRMADTINPTYDSEGNLIKSTADIAAVYSPFGSEEFGVYGTFWKTVIQLMDGAPDNYTVAPSVRLGVRAIDTYKLMKSMYGDPSLSIGDKLYESTKQLAKLTSGGNSIFRYYMYNAAQEKLSKTGQTTGMPSSDWDRFLTLLSVPNDKDRIEFDVRKTIRKDDEDVKELANLFWQHKTVTNGGDMDLGQLTDAFEAMNYYMDFTENQKEVFWDEVVKLSHQAGKSRFDTFFNMVLEKYRNHANPMYSDAELRAMRTLKQLAPPETQKEIEFIIDEMEQMKE